MGCGFKDVDASVVAFMQQSLVEKRDTYSYL
jgi:hypothetical protein